MKTDQNISIPEHLSEDKRKATVNNLLSIIATGSEEQVQQAVQFLKSPQIKVLPPDKPDTSSTP